MITWILLYFRRKSAEERAKLAILGVGDIVPDGIKYRNLSRYYQGTSCVLAVITLTIAVLAPMITIYFTGKARSEGHREGWVDRCMEEEVKRGILDDDKIALEAAIEVLYERRKTGGKKSR